MSHNRFSKEILVNEKILCRFKFTVTQRTDFLWKKITTNNLKFNKFPWNVKWIQIKFHLVTVKFWFPPSCLIENIRRKTLLQCVDFHDVKNRNLKVHFPSLGINDICNMDLLAKHYMCRQRLSKERNTMYCPRLISKKNQGYQNSFLILVSSHALDCWYLYPYRIPFFFK